MGIKHKTDVQTEEMTGCTAQPGSSAVYQTVQLLPYGCRKETVSDIEYATGGVFNACQARKTSHYIGVPASHTSLCATTLNVKPGSPAYTDIYGKFHPETPPATSMADSRTVWFNWYGQRELAVPKDEIEQARQDAYLRLAHMVDSVHMNVLQSVLELKDTKQTLAPLMKFAEFGKQVHKNGGVWLTKQIKKGTKRVFKKLSILSSLGEIANAYLWYTFGVAPTVSDVKTFLKQLSKGSLKVKGQSNIRIPKGQVMVQRYSCPPKTESIENAMFDSDQFRQNAQGGLRKRRVKLPPYSTSLHVPFPDDRLPEGHKVVVSWERGCYFARLAHDISLSMSEDMLRRMNWNCPPLATMWELVPFSFVIDWFVNIGDAIKNIERRTTGVDYSSAFEGVWHSVQHIQDEWYPTVQTCGFTGAPTGIPPEDWSSGGELDVQYSISLVPTRGTRSVSYDRYSGVGMPPIPGLHFSDTVKSYQISSGMALLIQFANGLLK